METQINSKPFGLNLSKSLIFNPEFPLGLAMMMDARFETILLRMRRQS